MTKPKRPDPPKNLAAAGKALWRSIMADLGDDWELDARELGHLERAAVCADRQAELDAAVEKDGATTTGSRGQLTIHPAVVECRQLELVRLRLLSAIETTNPTERPATPAQAQARKAAEVRWSIERGKYGKARPDK